jgi:hypothetical protein
VTLKLRAGIAEAAARSDSQRSPAAAGHIFELTGPVDYVRRLVEGYAAAGCEHLVLFFFHSGPDDLRRTLVLFAERVIRLFRDR